jgi:hypothetical protein
MRNLYAFVEHSKIELAAKAAQVEESKGSSENAAFKLQFEGLTKTSDKVFERFAVLAEFWNTMFPNSRDQWLKPRPKNLSQAEKIAEMHLGLENAVVELRAVRAEVRNTTIQVYICRKSRKNSLYLYIGLISR